MGMATLMWQVRGDSSGCKHIQVIICKCYYGEFSYQVKVVEYLRQKNMGSVSNGAAQSEHKAVFLAELAKEFQKSKGPFVAGGDFNILRKESERNKSWGL